MRTSIEQFMTSVSFFKFTVDLEKSRYYIPHAWSMICSFFCPRFIVNPDIIPLNKCLAFAKNGDFLQNES